jgi:hypothetical protein
MLAVNFHLMGGMPVHLARPALDETPMPPPVSEPVAPNADVIPSIGVAEARSEVVRGDAPAEVVMRRPIALQILLSKVRENLL